MIVESVKATLRADGLDVVLADKLSQLTTEDQIMLAWLVYRLGNPAEVTEDIWRDTAGQQGFRQSFV